MRILLFCSAFNGLSQRAFTELIQLDHEISIEFALSDELMIEAAELFKPDLIICPFLKRAVPEQVWRKYPTLIVHPGVPGDRGPYALDWAIMRGLDRWGVTLLQAEAEMDAGPIWAHRAFAMRQASKSSIYRNEVTDAAIACIKEALERFEDYLQGTWQPTPLADFKGAWGKPHPMIRRADRTIDWKAMDTATICRIIWAADSQPGAIVELAGEKYRAFGAEPLNYPLDGKPGEIICQHSESGRLLIKTRDGAIWLSHLKREGGIKLPAASLLPDRIPSSSRINLPGVLCPNDIVYWEEPFRDQLGRATGHFIGHLAWELHGAAFSPQQARALQALVSHAKARQVWALILWGGYDAFCNGIHLGDIEAASDPEARSLASIIAINDLIYELLNTPNMLVVSALRGGAGAGGAILALAADQLYLRQGVVINPHYKGMGLHGSEYWTYLLPERLGGEEARRVTEALLPIGAQQAYQLGYCDRVLSENHRCFEAEVRTIVSAALVCRQELLLKKARRLGAMLPELEAVRERELQQMAADFASANYHQLRRAFVYKLAPQATPTHLARHRQLALAAD